ncbi:MAG: phosphoadenosine phosphosulfate reductase, partial [Ignavibacteria bacterium]|nr:phosphoadenosine phosphosulfate reductase [Ignavibacteria bacterium]
IGVRKGESPERDKIITSNYTDRPYYLKQADYPNVKLFAPIINYQVSDIWSIVKSKQKPLSLKGIELEAMYQKAGEEQIDFIDSSSNALQKGRFGCWTCTVIRKDKAVKNLISNGCDELKPLLEFRNWIFVQRDNIDYRCKYRRNGVKGLGPFTLEARKEILVRLLKAQSECGFDIIADEEIEYIFDLWKKDENSNNYREK